MVVAFLPLLPRAGWGQSPGDVVVNEVMQNPLSVFDDAGEWFEVVNTTGSPVDINGWTIADNDIDSHVINNGGPLIVPANGFLVLGNNNDSATNGGLIVDYNYGDSFFLSNSADELVLFDGALAEIDRVEWDGGATFPDPNGAAMALGDPADDNNVGSNWCTASTPYGDGDFGTPGAANDCESEPPVILGACGDPATLIHDIQGSGNTSLLVGSTVVVEAVVVGDFQNNANLDDGDLNGFYLQEEEADSDPATSEGIFVFASGASDVAKGDRVRVLADVTEFVTSGGASSMTELSGIGDLAICASGQPLPEPAQVQLPLTSAGDLERFEGMQTVFTQTLAISEYFNYDRFGEIVLALPFAGEDRPFQPTAVVEPGTTANDLQALLDLRRVTLDDGQSSQNPDFNRHPNGDAFSLSNRFRGGDTVTDVIGVIDDTFGLYKIQPTEPAVYAATNTRPSTPDSVGGNVTVASFNVLNYFLTLDTGSNICGPEQNQGCRGADDVGEFNRQRVKILNALEAIDADVFGLIEMENTTGVSPLADIVSGLNSTLGADTYDYIDTGTIGTDAIKVGFIYKPETVAPLGDHAILDSSVDPRFLDDKNRPVLAQTFVDNNGAIFTVAVNHFKSKGSDCNDVGDPDLGDGQGNCNLTREAAAQALVDWLAEDPTSSGDPDYLIVGDLNSYDKEDPIDAVRAGSDDLAGTTDDYTDLVRDWVGELAYSFVFSGLFGYLDHALANEPMNGQVSGTTIWHINADEPDILDYDTTFKSPTQVGFFEENPYRSSDHDPVIVGLNANGSPVCDTAFASETTLFPPDHMFVAIEVQGVTDPESDPLTIFIDSIFQDEAVDAPDSGDTAPDGQGIGTDTAEVRAERVGTGNGRVYHIGFTATDTFGGNCSGVVKVEVPIGRRSAAIDDGPLFDSTAIR